MPRLKVAVHLITKANAYQIQSQEDAQAAAQSLDVDLDLQFAEADASRQIHQIYRHIGADPAARPQILIIEAVRDGGMERVAMSAAQAGIGVVLIHGDGSCLENVRKACPGIPLCWVTADNYAIGRLQGHQFRALIPKGGLVLYATGPTVSGTAQQRLAGAQEAVRGSNIELAVVSGADWTTPTGRKAITDWLRLVVPGGVAPALIGCQCDDFAVGAREALRETAPALRRLELVDIPVTGVDGVPSFGQQLVNQGELAATVIMPVATGPALALVVRALRENRPLPAKDVLAPHSYPNISSLRARQ